MAEHLVFRYSQGLHGDVEKVAFLVVIIFEEDPLESQKGTGQSSLGYCGLGISILGTWPEKYYPVPFADSRGSSS